MAEDVQQRIKEIIDTNNIVLFMKGEAETPMCGFSASVVQILQHMGADFHDVNVLEDPDVREGIKEFSDWPTIPQLYVGKEFIGGCDIVREMYMNGELQEILKQG